VIYITDPGETTASFRRGLTLCANINETVLVNVLLNKPTPPSFRHAATEITENSIENFVFFVSPWPGGQDGQCESDVQDLDDHCTI